MEAELSKTSMDRYETVCNVCFSREEMMESVVPDILPDIARIIDADASIALRSKVAESGRATVSASLDCTVIYLAEGGGGLQRLSFAMPFTAPVDAPELMEGSRMVAGLSLNAVDARLLNPRKVLLRADVCVCLDCYEPGQAELTSDIAAENGVQTLKKTANISAVTGVMEKTFVLSDEFQLTPSKPAIGELLKQRVTVSVEDVKNVGMKLVFKGTAHVGILYTAAEDGRLVTDEFTTSFSQILEKEEGCVEPVTELCVMPTGAYFEAMSTSYGTNAVSMELHLVAQAVCSQSVELRYVADAYSCEFESEVRTEVMALERIERELVLRETVREFLETPEVLREVLAVYVQPGMAAVEGGRVSAPLDVKVLFLTDTGEVSSVSRILKAESQAELEPGMELRVTSLRCAEPYASVASGGLELRLPMEIRMLLLEKVSLQSVAGLTLDEETPLAVAGRPSVTVAAADGHDIWTLAKTYLSTPELIESVNQGSLEAGEVLLIPRTR